MFGWVEMERTPILKAEIAELATNPASIRAPILPMIWVCSYFHGFFVIFVVN